MNRIFRIHLCLAFAFSCALFFTKTAPAQTATTTVLQVSPPCNTDGCVTTLTATVTAGGTPVHPGLVVFCDKGPADCQNVAPIGRAQLLADGTATIRLGLTPGPHSLRAIFHGTRTYASSSSAAQSTSTPGSTFQRTVYNGGSYATPKEGGYYFNTTYLISNYLPAGGTLSYIDASRGNAVLTSPAVVPYAQQQPEFYYMTGDPQAVSQIPPTLLTSAVREVTGDFNNDGFQDVLLIDGTTVLSLLLGNGKGDFTLAPTSKTQIGAHGAQLVADFNGDGKLDVAIPDAATNKIYIGLGDGTGNFTAAAPVTLTGSPQAIALGDFNNDGIPDVAAVSTVSGSRGEVDILLGQGDGTFSAQTPITRNGDVLQSIAVSDFNGDGNQDLVFFDQTAQALTVLKGNGDGTFAATPAAILPFANGNSVYLATGDLYGDTSPDIFFSAQYASASFKGNGDFTFTESLSTGGLATPFAFGDFVGDGGVSALVLEGEDLVALPDTTAIYSAPVQIVYSAPGVTPLLAVADFNGDGIPDALVVNSSQLQNPPGYGTPLTPIFLGQLANTQTVPSVKTIFFDPGYHNILDSYSGDTYHNPQTVPGTTIYSAGVDFYNGFTGSTGLTYNNAASLQGGAITLAGTGQFQTASLFTTNRLDLTQQLTGTFDFQFPAGPADGFAYVFQPNGPNAIGSSGGGLGYGNPPGAAGPAITNSLAVAFDLHNNQGEGSNSIRIEYNGVTSPVGAIDLTPFNIDLHSGHRFHVVLTSSNLTGAGQIGVSITDTVTKATTSQSFFVQQASPFFGKTGYIGFTAGTGTETAGPTIYDWQINTEQGVATVSPTTPYYSNGFSGATGLLFNGGSKLSGAALQLTNNASFEATSTYAARKIGAASYAINTDFDFTVGDGDGDGFTFVLQDHSPTAVGSSGGGLGYGVDYLGPVPSYAVIPNSLAIKFDLHNNHGEGPNSTGLYLNGASPTTPAVDLTPSGINLHNGHTFHARIEIEGNTVTLIITDLNDYKVFQNTFTVDNPSVLQEGAIYAGFTAGTGATPSSIQILNWTLTN